MEIEQGEPADFFAVMATEEIDQPMGSRDIGTNGVWRPAAIVGKMPRPARRKGPRRMLFPL
jgi:hypothetical protein